MQRTQTWGSGRAAALGLALVAVVPVLDAQAAVVTVADRAALAGPTSQINWSGLGGDFTDVGASPTLGSATVTGAPSFTVFQQAPTGSWSGNFSDGDSILSMYSATTGEVGGVFDITLASAVSGFGTQAQSFLFGAFAVNVKLYDSASVELGSFDFAGNSTPDGDNSALFLGFQSDALNISRVVISGMGAGGSINHITLGTGGFTTPVSAPATLALVLAGLALLRQLRPQGT